MMEILFFSASHFFDFVFNYRNVAPTAENVLHVVKRLCSYCLDKNSRNISWLRTIADVYFGKCVEYLKLGKHVNLRIL